jgi:S1-C subfamily serine protease
MIQGLADFSAAIANLVANAAPLVSAVRVGPNRHVTGLHWRNDTIMTVDQALPAQESYSVILASGALVASRNGPRDPASNLALVRLEIAVNAPRIVPGPEAPVGGIVLLVAAAADGSATARLGMVHARANGPGAGGPLLDLAATEAETGGVVLDTSGRVLGMAAPTATGQIGLIPHATISRLAEPNGGWTGAPAGAAPMTQAQPSVAAQITGARRGWLGVALQPITVPESLVARAGQTSGRMVVNITHGGPADEAGLRVGDVLLALNGQSTSGSHSARAFLGADRIGTQIEVKLLRDGAVLTTFLTVAGQAA